MFDPCLYLQICSIHFCTYKHVRYLQSLQTVVSEKENLKFLLNSEIRKVSEIEEKFANKENICNNILNEKNHLSLSLRQLEEKIKSDKKINDLRINDAINNVKEEQSKDKEHSLAELRECSLKELSSYQEKIHHLESALRLSEREIDAIKMYVTNFVRYPSFPFY